MSGVKFKMKLPTKEEFIERNTNIKYLVQDFIDDMYQTVIPCVCAMILFLSAIEGNINYFCIVPICFPLFIKIELKNLMVKK